MTSPPPDISEVRVVHGRLFSLPFFLSFRLRPLVSYIFPLFLRLFLSFFVFLCLPFFHTLLIPLFLPFGPSFSLASFPTCFLPFFLSLSFPPLFLFSNFPSSLSFLLNAHPHFPPPFHPPESIPNHTVKYG